MAKPRRQTYTMEMYLKKMKDQDIRSDQDVQRLSGAWSSSMANELVCTVLNGEYIPPVILGEEADSQMWVIDGLQRSTVLMMFRYGNSRITSSVEEPVIRYRAKARDAEGNAKINGNGDIVWEDREFDIRNRTYGRLPEELRKRFDEYQIETVIHEGYDMKQISKLVRRYNNHKAMNVSQKAFTFADRYARRIREILKKDFFIECTGYTKNERKNGTLERIIMESVMCMFHFDSWKKAGQIGEYINGNASMEEFDILDGHISRLEGIMTEGMYRLFNSRDSFILFTLFHRFADTGLPDGKFAEFLLHVIEMTEGADMNEFYGTDRNCSTKDKAVIAKKLGRLESLMHEFLDIRDEGTGADEDAGEEEDPVPGILAFVRACAAPHASRDDVEQYLEVLEGLEKGADPSSPLLEEANRPSLAAVVAYSFENDIDLDEWMPGWFAENDAYISDQRQNYVHMLDGLKEFMAHVHAA